MTGIFGCYSSSIDENKVVDAISMFGYNIEEILSATSCLLGSVSIDSTKTIERVRPQEDTELYVLTCGEIYNENITDLKKEIINLYKSGNLQKLQHLNGAFTAVIYDQKDEKLILVNDRYGSIKTYYYYDSDCFYFAPKILPLLTWGAKKSLRSESLVDFFIFRYILGDKTFFENIFELPQASILEFSQNSMKLKRYWTYEKSHQYVSRSKDELIDELYRLWQQSIKRRIKKDQRMILPLSGGLDSRAILAEVVRSSVCENIVAYTYGFKGSYDFEIAKMIAKKAGVKHIAIEAKKEDFSHQYTLAMNDIEGMIDATPYFSINMKDSLNEYGKMIYSGFMGGEIMGPQIFRKLQHIPLTSENDYKKVKKIIFDHYKFNDPKLILPLINSRYLKRNNYLMSFENSIKELSKISVEKLPEFCATWLYDHESNKYTKYCNLRYRNSFDYILPFLDNDLVDFMLSIPPEYKLNKNLYKSMLIKKYPEFFNLPTKNSYGLKLTTNNLIKFIMRFTLFLKRQLNIFSAYLINKNLFLDKNQNYLNYDDLLRTNNKYQDYIRIMLNKVKRREYFNKDYLELLWTAHLKGRKNYATIFGLLVTFELFLEMYFDDDNKSNTQNSVQDRST